MRTTQKCMAFLLLVVTLCSYAKEPGAIDPGLDNLAGEYATCAAYFSLVSKGLAASNSPEAAAEYHEAEETAMFYSLLLANEGRTRDMAVKVTNARIEINLSAMKSEVDNRNENISILANKHSGGCERLIKTPPRQVEEIMKRRFKESSS